MLCEVSLERGERFGGCHVGHEAHVDLGDALCGKNCLSAGTGVSADEAFDVDRWARQSAVRALPANSRRGPSARRPAASWLRLRSGAARLRRSFAFQRRRAGRALSANPSMAGVLPSGETSVASAWTRCQAGLSTRALLLEWMSFFGPRPHFSPLEVSSSSHHAFGAKVHGDVAIGALAAKGMNMPVHFFKCGLRLRDGLRL